MTADTYKFGIQRMDSDLHLAETRRDIEADTELELWEKCDLYCQIIDRLMFLRRRNLTAKNAENAKA